MPRPLAAWLVAGAAFLAAPPATADDKAPPPQKPESADDVAAAKALEKRLESPNKLDLIAAIDDLGKLDTPTSRQALMKFIAGTPNSEYGSKAVAALGKAGNTTVVDFLCGKDGARSPRILVAEASCKSLAKIGDKRAIPTLLECMKADKTVVVCAAVESVVQLDPTAEGLADRLTALSTTKDDTVRMSVATALGELKSAKVGATLIAMTKDTNSIVRLDACKSIGRLVLVEAKKALEEVSAKDKNKEVREAAAAALLKIAYETSGK